MTCWSPTPARNGPNSIDGSPPSTRSSSLALRRTKTPSRLTTIPGVGPTMASALVAAVGKAETFEHGRDLAAWLGLVPRQFTTGGKPKLLGISKRGNKYLRKLLIHGARAALPHVAERDTALGRWAKAARPRPHQCRRRGARQQARPDRLGGAATREKIRRQGIAPWRHRRLIDRAE